MHSSASRPDLQPGFEAKASEELEHKPLRHRIPQRPLPLLQAHVKDEHRRCVKPLNEDQIVGAAAGEDVVEIVESLEEPLKHPLNFPPLFPVKLPDPNPLYDVRPIMP